MGTYKRLYNFPYFRAEKAGHISYLEDFTKILYNVGDLIDSGKYYFFSDDCYLYSTVDEPNTNYRTFISDLKNTFTNCCDNKICIIRGRAGIGKTKFFESGIQKLINDSQINAKYIRMGVDFKNIDNDKDIGDYEALIYKKLHDRAINSISLLGNQEFADFTEQYNESGYTNYDISFSWLFPLMWFCKQIYSKHQKPCIIVFDNIDLASVKTQKHVFQATVNICSEFNDFMHSQNLDNMYRVYFVMRPETHMHNEEAALMGAINFPLPNLLKIFLRIVKSAIDDIKKEYGDERMSAELTCVNVIKNHTDSMIRLKTYGDVADYFYRILDSYLNDIWGNGNRNGISQRLGSSEDFHCKIVNYDVRKFLRFMADTIKEGGFTPLTSEFNRDGTGYYNVYDYLEMIIRGKWRVHPGNEHINGEGGNQAPIIFNLFDTTIYSENQSDKIRHFMLFIRVLQYFRIHGGGEDVIYRHLRTALSEFFSQGTIKNVVKRLVHVRILYSYKQGDEAIAAIRDWRKIIIEDDTPIKLTPTGQFYLDKLICEYEYLYQMSMSSLINAEYFEDFKACRKIDKERAVLIFLKSIYDLIKENIAAYEKNKVLENFAETFYIYEESDCCHPFRRMLESFVSTIDSKYRVAVINNESRADSLNDTLSQAKDLYNESMRYFEDKLGAWL